VIDRKERLRRLCEQAPELAGLPYVETPLHILSPPGAIVPEERARAARERWNYEFTVPVPDHSVRRRVTVDGEGNILKSVESKDGSPVAVGDLKEEEMMGDTTVTINGTTYVVAPGGVLADLDGNLCGFVGGDIVKAAGIADDTPNFSDTLVGAFAQRMTADGAKGNWAARGLRAGIALTAPEMVAVGLGAAGAMALADAAGRAYNMERDERELIKDENEANEAEARARETERRVREARSRHGQ